MLPLEFWNSASGKIVIREVVGKNVELLDAWQEARQTPDIIDIQFTTIEEVDSCLSADEGKIRGAAMIVVKMKTPKSLTEEPMVSTVELYSDFVMTDRLEIESLKFRKGMPYFKECILYQPA